MIHGIEMNLGGRDLVVPPLSARSVREFALDGTFEKVSQSTTSMPTAAEVEAFDAVVRVIHAAIQRNHPEVTREAVLDILDVGNMPTLMAAVMGQTTGNRKADPNAVSP